MQRGEAIAGEAAIRAWVEAYVVAWNSNARGQIAALFAAGAEYWIAPYGEPWRGPEEIVAGWLQNRDEPGDTGFEWSVVGHDGDLWVVEATTVYRSLGKTYSNLWLVRLDEYGRCTEFREWWMEQLPAAE